MSRLTNEQLKRWALPHSTNRKGDCAGVSDYLLTANFANFIGDRPSSRKKKAVTLEGEEKTSHVGILLRWNDTNEEVIVDATIQQFGGEERVFVGSYDDWVDRLKQLTHAQKATPIDSDYGGLYDVLDTLDSLSAMNANSQRRSTGIASGETLQAETLKKGCGCTLF